MKLLHEIYLERSREIATAQGPRNDTAMKLLAIETPLRLKATQGHASCDPTSPFGLRRDTR